MSSKAFLRAAVSLSLVFGSTALVRATVPADVGWISEGSAQVDTLDTQVTRGEVTLEVTPRWEDGKLLVEVRASTHTVELSRLDLGAQTRLLVGDREIAPASAGKLLGHHGRAILVFRLKQRPERFVIEIRDVPDVPLRRLIWPLGDTSP